MTQRSTDQPTHLSLATTPAHSGQVDGSLGPTDSYAAVRLLEIAARDAEAWRVEAEAEAQALIADARSNADRMIADARAEAGRMREEADRHAGEVRRDLDLAVQDQEARIAELRRLESDGREQLRTLLSDLMVRVEHEADPTA